MADDLSAPLQGRKKKQRQDASHDALRSRLPVARALLALIVLLAGAFMLRLALVDDPDGGRPTAEVEISSKRDGNAVANDLAQRPLDGPGGITADPQQFPVSPDAPPLQSANRTAAGALPDLSEETNDGPIPRVSATGKTPFAAYSRPVDASEIDGKTKIAIVVSGLGINETGSLDAIELLPTAVSLAFAPYGKTLISSVTTAQNAGHEIFLEVPLEPFDYPSNDPGPQTLLTGDAPRANLDKLFWLMARFGGYVGIMNNMGARFTASAADFSPVMEELGTRGLGYLDDGSSNRSVAPQLASGNKVPFARADLLLDDNPAREPILTALSALEAKATKNGGAIGVISALPISIRTVAEWSKELDGKGFTLVPASALMK